MRLSSNVEYFDESDIDEGYFYGYYGYYDSLTGIKYKIGVSGAEENNKDIKNVFNESLKKAGKYKVQIYEYGSTDAIGEGYEINILPASSLPELKTGTNSDIKEMQWYKYVPEVTGLYYIPNVNVIRDQDFEYCNSKGETAYFLEKGKEYYMRFIVWDLDQKEITIEQSPKVTGITIKPNANEGVWAESRTRIEGQYVITTESGSEVEGDYYMSNDVHDKYGHLITVEVKDADGNLIQDFSKELKPGKYTYQVKVDGAETEIYTYTVKEPSVYKQLKVGKNDVTLDEKYNSSVGYYQFIPEGCEMLSRGYDNYYELPLIGILPAKFDEDLWLRRIKKISFSLYGGYFNENPIEFGVALQENIHSVINFISKFNWSHRGVSTDYEFFIRNSKNKYGY